MDPSFSGFHFNLVLLARRNPYLRAHIFLFSYGIIHVFANNLHNMSG